MQQDTPDTSNTRTKRRRRRTIAWTVVIFAILVNGAVGSAFWIKGREFVAPEWLRDQIAVRLAPQLPDIDFSFGDVVLVMEQDWRPRFLVRDVAFRTHEGAEIISVSNVSGAFDPAALLDRRLSLSSVRADGVFVTLRRAQNGALSLSAGLDGGSVRREAPNLARMISDLDDLFLRPAMSELQQVDVRAITLRYEDLRASRVWTVDGGRMRLDREGSALQIAVDLAILGGQAEAATLSATYAGNIGQLASEFGVTLANLEAQDLASQGPALSWLRAVEAPISGALRGGVREDGTFNPLSATLQIGAGVIQPRPEARPIPIDGARSYFSYLPDEKQLRFDALSVDSQWGSGRLEGQAVLGRVEGGQIQDLVGQFRLTDLAVNPDGLYPERVNVAAAELDFRLSLAPFAMEIGRFQVSDQGQVLSAHGTVKAGQQGWDVAMDAQMDGLSAPRLLELWPQRLKPKTRRWIDENVQSGRVRDAVSAIRIKQGGEPNLYLAFDFDDASFSFTPDMPLVEKAKGHGSLVQDRFVMVFDRGKLTAPEGGEVDAAGTSFIVPDTKAKPDPPGIVRLAADGSVTAALSLLDQPPLKVMQKANLPVQIAEGRVSVSGTISLPLMKKIPIEAVSFDVTGTVRNAGSTILIKDKVLAADELTLTASEDLVRVSGAGTLSGIPLTLAWQQPLGAPGDILPGLVTGEVEISQTALEAFNIELPPGSLSGASVGDMRLDMLKGTPPKLSIRSDLRGLAVALRPIGWSKPAQQTASLEVDLTLGDTPGVDRLVLDAPGLYADGSVSLTGDQKLDRVRFNEVRIGNWLNAPVDLIGRGEGKPVAISVRGGEVDLRRADLPQNSGGGQPGGSLTLALDRLRVSDTIALTDMRGVFSTTGGLDGNFRGAVNGAAQVSGQLRRQNGRSAVRVTSADAGQLFAAAGLLSQARDGRLQLDLVPVGKEGAFDGTLTIQDTRITQAPTIAALLNAISVVGLINELNGDGIYFSEVKADFRLTPSRITVREASAVGASLGLSMDGFFEPDTKRVQMQGVISPIYMLNSIGRVLTREGEGLFGFNYSISGTTKDPQVFVNPLTALAPGMFRNLFRNAKPVVPLEAGEPPPKVEQRKPPVVTRGEDR